MIIESDKGLARQRDRVCASGPPSPNAERHGNTRGAMRRAQIGVAGGDRGRWPDRKRSWVRAFFLNAFAACRALCNGQSVRNAAASRHALQTIPAAPENRSVSTMWSAAAVNRCRAFASRSRRAYLLPTRARTNATPASPVNKPSDVPACCVPASRSAAARMTPSKRGRRAVQSIAARPTIMPARPDPIVSPGGWFARPFAKAAPVGGRSFASTAQRLAAAMIFRPRRCVIRADRSRRGAGTAHTRLASRPATRLIACIVRPHLDAGRDPGSWRRQLFGRWASGRKR